MSGLRVCINSHCIHGGTKQSSENFYIKSRYKDKVYYEKICKACKRKPRSIKFPKVVTTTQYLEEGSNFNNESILEEYNSLKPDHILTIDELECTIKAFSLLSMWSQERKNNGKSSTIL